MERLENKQILGIIDATTHIDSLGTLTTNRSIASLPFSGRYRLIDFMLSNMVHAGIDSVGVFSHYLHNSLKSHIGSGKVWDLDRKNGGLFFYVQNEHEKDNSQLILHYNKQFFTRAPYQYVIVAPSNIVGRIPISEMLAQHKEHQATVTQAVYAGKGLPIYILELNLLVKFLDKMDTTTPQTLMKFIKTSLQHIEKDSYNVRETLYIIDSLASYYETEMKLLTLSDWRNVFSKAYPVFTKTKDEPPTKYLEGSSVAGAIIANGSVIDGKVTNSIISRGVKVGKNSIIRNSIIMPKVEIGDDCILDHVIVDKDVTIEVGVVLKGKGDEPRVIPKGTTIHKEWG